jgi:uncharacterized protein YdhG (YjbR/CyaY superfamily)
MATSTTNQFKTVDEYIASFPVDVSKRLRQIRKTIKEVATNAGETMSYQIPTFTLNGYLVHFAAWKNHIAMYPAPSGSEAFNKKLSRYLAKKSTIQFPLDKPLPLTLIRKIAQYRVKEKSARKRARK